MLCRNINHISWSTTFRLIIRTWVCEALCRRITLSIRRVLLRGLNIEVLLIAKDMIFTNKFSPMEPYPYFKIISYTCSISVLCKATSGFAMWDIEKVFLHTLYYLTKLIRRNSAPLGVQSYLWPEKITKSGLCEATGVHRV